MTTLKRFTLFPHLPTELRLKVYQQIQDQDKRQIQNESQHGNQHQPTSAAASEGGIVKISYSPSQSRYISNTPPPLTFSISHESREQALLSYSYLHLGNQPVTVLKSNPEPPPKAPPQWGSISHLSHYYHHPNPQHPDQRGALQQHHHEKQPTHTSIPISFRHSTLYISSLSPLLPTFQHTFLFHLSTSPSRHYITSLAIDLRVWNELCENGFLGILAKMRCLRELLLVVEFGRLFRGVLGWLEAPEWRGDLRWVADRAEGDVGSVRRVVRGRGNVKGSVEEEGEEVRVRCVILTRGGEQA